MKQKTLYILLFVCLLIVIGLAIVLIFKKNSIAKKEYQKNKEAYEQLKSENDSLNTMQESLEKELNELQNRSIR
jgi:cell division protein FtsB